MGQSIRDVMTADPVALPLDETIVEAARAMRDRDIGNVIVLDGDQVAGIVTDRDIVVRAVADNRDCTALRLRDVHTPNPLTVDPSTSMEDAVHLMRDNALRRLPVVETGRPVGIVSLGDLAIEREPKSALAGISAAPAND
jgi:CBS domain-containing protein